MNMPTHITTNGTMLGAAGCAAAGCRVDRSLRGHLRCRCGRVDADRGRQARAAAAPASRRRRRCAMRTGTRCTILVKLPVAFSGGITLKTAPVAGARLSTWPRKCGPAAHRRRSSPSAPGRIRASWSSLKLASTQSPCAGTIDKQGRADSCICTDLGGAVADIAVDRRADLGVAEIEPGGPQIGLGLRQARLGLGDLGVEHGELLLGGVERRPRPSATAASACDRRRTPSGRSAASRRWSAPARDSGRHRRAHKPASAWSGRELGLRLRDHRSAAASYFACRLASAAVCCCTTASACARLAW